MGYKNVCLNCNKAFSIGSDFKNMHESNCPECGQKMIEVNHKFKPPKKTDSKKWAVVKYLIENGFKYQRIFSNVEGLGLFAENYPEDIKAAKEFVHKFAKQAISR